MFIHVQPIFSLGLINKCSQASPKEAIFGVRSKGSSSKFPFASDATLNTWHVASWRVPPQKMQRGKCKEKGEWRDIGAGRAEVGRGRSVIRTGMIVTRRKIRREKVAFPGLMPTASSPLG
jgi:hypothetical protein